MSEMVRFLMGVSNMVPYYMGHERDGTFLWSMSEMVRFYGHERAWMGITA